MLQPPLLADNTPPVNNTPMSRRPAPRALIPIALALLALAACQLSDARQSVPILQTGTASARTLTPLPVSVTHVAPGANASATRRPTHAPDATTTSTPQGTPTATPPFRELAGGDLRVYSTPPRPLVTPIPPAAAPIAAPRHVTTVLLLGSDQRPERRGNATDTIILVAVNRSTNTANMLSIPRDTYVYIPGWTMDRVNTALVRGDITGWPGGGIDLLRETLLYNFGVTVDYYARVDLNGFERIVDTVDGIDVPVDCALTDWRLISPELDINDENNWEQYTLGVGVHHMDGDLALWYARARRSTSDFDRNRRQQQVLRALWQKSRTIDLVADLPTLWEQSTEIVETDMQLVDAVEMLPVALDMDSGGVRGRNLSEVLTGWQTPDTHASVQLPDLEQAPRLFEWLYLEPAVYAVAQEASTIEVLNGTANDDWDVVAADRLGWEGLVAIAAGPTGDGDQERTQIFDYTGQVKGTSAAVLARILNVPPEDVIVQPDPARDVDFRVVLGYNYHSCTYR